MQATEGEIAPKRARTSNHLIRSQVLYPIELSVLKCTRHDSGYVLSWKDLPMQYCLPWMTL